MDEIPDHRDARAAQAVTLPPSAAASPSGASPVAAPLAGAPAAGAPPAARPNHVPWPAVIAFIVTAYALAWLTCIPLWLNGGLTNAVLLQVSASAMMLAPLLATIVALAIQRPKVTAKRRYLGIWPLRPAKRVVWMTVALFFGMMVLAMLTLLLADALGWTELDLAHLSGFRAYLASTAGKQLGATPMAVLVAIQLAAIPFNGLVTALFAFGEEVGWRGWLLTSLRPLGTWPALIITGVVWGVWHSPLILLGYNFNRPNLAGVALMVGGCVAIGVLLGWTRLRTGSIWPAVFGHAALNASTGSLVILTFRAGSTPDGASTSLLGFPGWIIIAVIVVALLATGQFQRQPELAPSKPKAAQTPPTSAAPA